MSRRDAYLTTAQGARLYDTDHSLKAGERGPTLLQDHHLREKITHFDHERIPERVVHARGAAAHGVFQGYGTAAKVTKAAFLVKDVETKVFVRFSTVLGSRGSADTVRDTRGFAVKFYTGEGTFRLVDAKGATSLVKFHWKPKLGVHSLVWEEAGGKLDDGKGEPVVVQRTFATARSIEFDAVLLAGTPQAGADAYGARDAKADENHAATTDPRVLLLVSEAYRHGKAIGGWADAGRALEAAGVPGTAPGVILDETGDTVLDKITALLATHRVWEKFPAGH